MKFIITFFLGIIILGGFIYFYHPTPFFNQPSQTIPSPSNTLTINAPAAGLSYKNIDYLLYMQAVSFPNQLTLIPNFTDKKSSKILLEEDNCRYGINAGFYTTDDQPLGLFMTNNQKLSPEIPNSLLLNGFFYKNNDGTIEIASHAPQENPEFIFQSGPLFTPYTQLKINNDASERRNVIGKTTDGKFYFISIVTAENNKNGPLLADLPAIFQTFNNASELQFALLLNLDGGSAAAFFDNSGNAMEELTYVGAFICGK